ARTLRIPLPMPYRPSPSMGRLKGSRHCKHEGWIGYVLRPTQLAEYFTWPAILKRASASRSSGEWNDDDFDVLADGAVVGRIRKANAAPVGSPWLCACLWTS